MPPKSAPGPFAKAEWILTKQKSREKVQIQPAMSHGSEVLRDLAIVPSDSVLFPGSSLPVTPLSGLSARNLRLMQQRGLRVGVLRCRGEPDDPRNFARVGTLAHVTQLLRISAHQTGAVLQGSQRFKVEHLEKRRYGWVAQVRLIDSVPPRVTQRHLATVRALKTAVGRLLESLASISDDARAEILACDDPAKLCDLVVPHLSLGAEERQLLLEDVDVRRRMRAVMNAMRREHGLVELSTRIHSEVEGDLHENYRREYLVEQIRTLKRELGEMDGELSEIEKLTKALDEVALPTAVREGVREELDRLQSMGPGSPDYYVTYNYLCLIRDLPWGSAELRLPDFADAARILSRSHFGLDDVKDQVLEYLAVMLHRQSVRGQVLLLNGPPGVGKTSLAEAIASALGRPFVRVALGGVKDEAEIRGHRRTYIGAMPGKILQGIKHAKSAAPVMLLDEVDKLSGEGKRQVEGALLELLDPAQNRQFVDHFLGMPFDLSGVLFVATSNDADALHPALLDRMQRIDVPAYTEVEKIAIARRHLLPIVRKDLALRVEQLQFGAKALRAIIRRYTSEAGVRQLRRELEQIGRKRVRNMLMARRTRWTPITPEELPAWLGPPRYLGETLPKAGQAGVAVGLAYTEFGGDILIIEASRVHQDGQLEPRLRLTGSLGKVMRESAQTALTYLHCHASLLHLRPEDFTGQSFHLHFPDGATPKDGPSAGIGILCALASSLKGIPLPADLAMTGEVTLRGQVLPVGGIREKVLASMRYGRRRILMPMGNAADVEKLPAEVRRRAEIVLVDDLSQVLMLTGLTARIRMPVVAPATNKQRNL